MQLLPPTSPRGADDKRPKTLPEAVAIVFGTITRLRGGDSRWSEVARDPKSLRVWERALELAGISPDDAMTGLAKLCQLELPHPPTAGQFIRLCRPPMPTDAESLAEAQR